MSPDFDTFKARAEAVSAEVHRFPTRSKATDFILEFVQSENDSVASALWADGSFLSGVDKQQIAAKAHSLGFDVNRDTAAAAKIGISQMDFGIANTGTLVQDATAVEKRLVSTLPLIHVAIVGTDTIMPDLPTLLTRINPRKAEYISFITGPSRTADIERVLTIGVHGPERLIIVAVDDLGGAA